VLSSTILLIVMVTNSLNLNINMQFQKGIWFLFPLLPILIIFFIGSVAETNRAPFDLAEAESELVSGFMTEHAAVIFVFFFLAEYGSILLMCILTSIFFIGGYLFSFDLIYFLDIINYIWAYSFDIDWIYSTEYTDAKYILKNSTVNNVLYSLTLGLKSAIMIFIFIWVRASFPRIRFDQLMSFCWTVLLPILFAFIVLLPCLLYQFNMTLININLF
jgi:NADH-ubiquinone oxidoreductase chain 1